MEGFVFYGKLIVFDQFSPLSSTSHVQNNYNCSGDAAHAMPPFLGQGGNQVRLLILYARIYRC